MRLWHSLRLRLVALWQRPDREKELDRELESHLDLEAEEQLESGLSPQEARYAAQRAFGNTTLVRADLHAIWQDHLARAACESYQIRRAIASQKSWFHCHRRSHSGFANTIFPTGSVFPVCEISRLSMP